MQLKIEFEIWKPIEGFEGLYEVSNTGKVKRIGSTISKLRNGKFYTVYWGERFLKPDDFGEYLLVTLYKNGDRKTLLVHRLVATAFHQNLENKPEVNHKDGNKRNNNDWNLEWNTCKENTQHAHNIGLQVAPKGFESKCSKPVSQYTKTGQLINIFGSGREAMRETGIHQSLISKTAKGEIKFAGGFVWKYAM